MADKVRFGILGLGMGRGKAEICTKTEGAELVAICDIWEERALETKEKLMLDPVCASFLHTSKLWSIL